ncbi:MAG: NAD(P)-dependent oxidoreductase, partial [Mangrovicoccus sp.]
MKLIIFGATGSIGRHVVAQAQADGHQVTAFTRSGQAPKDTPNGVSVIKGDVLNPIDVANAIEGHDAVICVLGNGAKGGLRAEGTENIVAGMKWHRVT